MLSLTACTGNKSDTGDSVTTREEQPVPETPPEDDSWGYEPNMVLFHNVTVVKDNDIACFDDGDDSPYCGVHKIYLTVWDDWGGLGDQGSCEIVHRVAPEYLVDNGATADLVEAGAMNGWEIDATQSLIATSTMCDFIKEGTHQHTVFEKFKTQNLVWGVVTPTEDMLNEYREGYSDITNEEWETDVAPYLTAHINKVNDVYRVPNMSVAYQIDGENTPVVGDDGDFTAGEINTTELIDGYYRSPPFYVYSIDRFAMEE
jgi:hypothetical protein